MKTKVCPKCKKEKSVDCFYKNKTRADGLACWCKECNRKYQKEWYKDNPKYYRERRKKNPEYQREYQQEWYQKNKEEIKKRSKEWKKNNPEYQREWQKNRKANDPKFKLNSNIATAIGKSLRGNKAGKHWESLVGYTLQDLMSRLSVNFQEGMSWEKLLNGEIHIDHKKPKSLFNFKTPEEQAFKDCWSLANLQLLWAEDNLRKNNKFIKGRKLN